MVTTTTAPVRWSSAEMVVVRWQVVAGSAVDACVEVGGRASGWLTGGGDDRGRGRYRWQS
ncbi:MAG TPA: hypothetical protein DCP08_08795 [Chloroflexi bacterium]|nr:hypothetical protein [Chloroflexota bacterium]